MIGPDHDAVDQEATRIVPDAQIAVQRERRGTAHAVLAAKDAIARGFDDLLVIFADTPLITPGHLVASCAARSRMAPRSRCLVFARPIRPAMGGW